jgi:hypothetical protein
MKFRVRCDEWPLDEWRTIGGPARSYRRLPAEGDIWTLPTADGTEEWRIAVVADDPEEGIDLRLILSRVDDQPG